MLAGRLNHNIANMRARRAIVRQDRANRIAMADAMRQDGASYRTIAEVIQTPPSKEAQGLAMTKEMVVEKVRDLCGNRQTIFTNGVPGTVCMA